MAKSDKVKNRKQRVVKGLRDSDRQRADDSYAIERRRQIIALGVLGFVIFWALSTVGLGNRFVSAQSDGTASTVGIGEIFANPSLLLMGFGFALFVFALQIGFHRKVQPLDEFQVSKWTGLIVLFMVIPVCSALSEVLLPFNAIPVIVVAMLLSKIFRSTYVLFHLFMGLFVMMVLRGYDIYQWMVAASGALTALYMHRSFTKRFDEIRVGIVAGIAMCLTHILVALHKDILAQETLWRAMLNVGADYRPFILHMIQGISSPFMVMLLMPLLERVFDVVSDSTLLELSDHNHPLLRDLLFRAPGTYNHSLMVGTLSEEAAHMVGANALACRVGSYYHDIGKMLKPEYFTENEMGRENKHIDLSPSISALIITSHPKDGLEMAEEHGLPTVIKDIIMQHHGTSKIEFFYRKALQIQEDDESVDESLFRYPGPRPTSKEAGIVMIADSIEASTRSLADPTPSRIRNLVHIIIQGKIDDHQFDECPLTMRELSTIEETLVKMLIGIFHSRVAYPDDKPKPSENRDNREAGQTKEARVIHPSNGKGSPSSNGNGGNGSGDTGSQGSHGGHGSKGNKANGNKSSNSQPRAS